jgi:hypothetical protein
MFLQIIGWLALVVVLVVLTLNWVVLAFNYLGKWTIGGAENNTRTRLMVLVFGAIITYGWYVTGTMAPFTITFGVN